MSTAAALAAEVAEAHGGLERWGAVETMTVDFASGGLAFTTKGRAHALEEVTGRFWPGSRAVQLNGQRPRPWGYRASGTADLAADLAALRGMRPKLRWSTAQLGAFAAAAMWTYLTIPFVLGGPGVSLETLPPRQGLRRLRVRFPGAIATHCPQQVLHIDPEGLIRRHDYTALAFGRWARAAQIVGGYRSFAGVLVATDRRVSPRLLGRPAPTPTLVWIRINQVRVASETEIQL